MKRSKSTFSITSPRNYKSMKQHPQCIGSLHFGYYSLVGEAGAQDVFILQRCDVVVGIISTLTSIIQTLFTKMSWHDMRH